ncbi:MAG: hypothetical protein AAB373_02790 [Patescibacteria group bacterium]
MAKKTKSKKKHSLFPVSFGIGSLIGAWILIILTLIFFLGRTIYLSDEATMPIGYYFLLLGLVFEFQRNIKSWPKTFTVATLSFAFSSLVFVSDDTTLQQAIVEWPFFFCGLFMFMALNYLKGKITPKLTEGITLLQSVAIIYWITDLFTRNSFHPLSIILISTSIFFPIFSLYHAFSYNHLSDRSKFLLSFWSSVIMLIFAIENIHAVYQSGMIENAINFGDKLYSAAEYFLLGIASMYIVENFFFIFPFIPGSRFFYFCLQFNYKEIRALAKQRHVERYSDQQVKKSHAFFGLLFTSILFGLNYYYNFVGRNFIIWAAFAIFPIFLYFYQRLTTKKAL